MRIRRARRWLALLLLALAAPVPASAAVLQFVSGTIQYIGTDINCVNQSEIEQGAYAGYTLRNSAIPAPGEIWYAHVVVAELGNPCPVGGSYTTIEMSLPPSTAFAISADNPVFCAIKNASNQVTVYSKQSQGCPQAPIAGAETGYYDIPAYNGTQVQPWPIASGTFLELMIPLRSSAPMSAKTLSFRVSPEVGVVGYATDNALYISNDTIFRNDMDNDTIVPDVCAGAASCTLAP